MHAGVTCIGEHETVSAAARKMWELGVGALPVLGDDAQLRGMLTDRDIAIKCVAAGEDPRTVAAGQLAQGNVYHIGGEASIEQMLAVMEEHKVRRLPVVEDHRLVGIVSEADLARHLPGHAVANFIKAVCAPQQITA